MAWSPTMIKTYGLTHIALAVRDVARSSRFYQTVFGARVVYDGAGFVQLQTPGTRDVIVLEQADARGVGQSGGIAHFGFRLMDPADIGDAVDQIAAAGGTIKSVGEFCPGEPYVFALDPDGYELEVWFEIPTPLDPPAADVEHRE
jgi:catechol 2,3-dioxygenase-like lactoylglutathione lyase family enzyme